MKHLQPLPLVLLALLAVITGLAFAAYARPELQALWQLAYSLCR